MLENILKQKANQIGIDLSKNQIQKFLLYKDMLLEWNEKINLTAITDPEEIIVKHFIDSLTCVKYIKEGSKVIDIGTGAGFPGIPLKIYFEDKIHITLLDSLNKRINFLNEVIKELRLDEIDTIHSRAEDAGTNGLYREKFDVVLSRAVSNMAILAEYCMPLVKVNGSMICMKGNNPEGEIEEAKKAIDALGGKIERIEHIILPDTDINRSFVLLNKIKQTPKEYPRKAGKASKNPIR
jgi:16S rRNA (guanine527-N7)-methyltransferase